MRQRPYLLSLSWRILENLDIIIIFLGAVLAKEAGAAQHGLESCFIFWVRKNAARLWCPAADVTGLDITGSTSYPNLAWKPRLLCALLGVRPRSGSRVCYCWSVLVSLSFADT